MRTFAIVLAAALAGITVPARAASPEDAFDQACHAYEQGKWDEAADGFRSLLRYGLEDPRIDYNLANSEYKRGHIGEAILHYEKARRLDPADPDIAANLGAARARIRDVIEDPTAAGPMSAWRSLQDRIGVAPQTLAALAGLWIVAGIVTWCASRAGGFTPGWGWGLSAAILATLLLSLSARATWLRLEGTPRAVILKSSVEALAGPGLNNTTLFTLHEGTAVEVRAERPGWVQVALPNGLTGWVETMPPPASEAPLGLYVHFPFCSVRCTYCDFPTVAGRDDRIEAYLDALDREIAQGQPDAVGRVDSIFFGGGTPSRMTGAQAARVLRALGERFDVASDTEITLEGNPESLTAEALAGFAEAGVNRISIGVQSLNDRVLARVGRAHDADGARRAVADARRAGFREVSADLIAGLPGEDLESWPRTMGEAAAWGCDHLSVYLLESDKDTPLGRSVRSGRVRIADDDAMAALYEATVATLEDAGYETYEISNFARNGKRSRHNLKYWTDAPFAGFGLGAHGYVAGERRANRADLDGYLAEVEAGRSPIATRDPFDPSRRLEEALFLGLRVAEGVDLDALGARYGYDVRARFASAWERGEAAGLIVRSGGGVRLTPAGRLRSNELFAELIGEQR